MKQIGFTGTKNGMSKVQELQVDRLLTKIGKNGAFHNGDCVGADEQACRIADSIGMRIILHPPIKQNKRAFCRADETRLEKEYLDRNRDIVAESELVIATPKETKEQFRGSGTWMTIRATRKAGKKLIIIWPDGSFSSE
jgi:hypothetical protein